MLLCLWRICICCVTIQYNTISTKCTQLVCMLNHTWIHANMASRSKGQKCCYNDHSIPLIICMYMYMHTKLIIEWMYAHTHTHTHVHIHTHTHTHIHTYTYTYIHTNTHTHTHTRTHTYTYTHTHTHLVTHKFQTTDFISNPISEIHSGNLKRVSYQTSTSKENRNEKHSHLERVWLSES